MFSQLPRMVQITRASVLVSTAILLLGTGRALAVPVIAVSANPYLKLQVLGLGVTVAPNKTNTTDAAHLVQEKDGKPVDYGSVSNDDATDAKQAASGPGKPPAENTFGRAIFSGPGLARSDVKVYPFDRLLRSRTGANVAEVYLAAPGTGSGSAEDTMDFSVTQSGAAPIDFRFESLAFDVNAITTSVGDIARAQLAASLQVTDPSGKKKALWLPGGSTGQAADNNCAIAGNGLTVDPGFAGTVRIINDPGTLNKTVTCADAGCDRVYHSFFPLYYDLSVNVGMGNTVSAEVNMYEAVFVSGVAAAKISEPSSFIPLLAGSSVLWVRSRLRCRPAQTAARSIGL